jgi:hypothetical protein
MEGVMPKELVYSDTYPYSTTEPARSVVDIRWSRESSHVQIATRCVDASTEATYKNEEFSTLSAADGWYLDLDRRAINELIRKLRRARDQAFGRDE